MPVSENDYIPAVVRLPAGLPPVWGRLAALDPLGCSLFSRFPLKEGSSAALEFPLGGEAFADILVRVRRRRADPEGYFLYRLAFTDPLQRTGLKLALVRAAAARDSAPAK